MPLLSIFSTAMLLAAILCGADVSLHSVEVGLSVRPGHLELAVDPVFVARTELAHAYGLCLGNVILVDRCVAGWGAEDERRVVLHEVRHVDHFQAFGMLTPIAGMMFRLEPEHVNWSVPSVELSEMLAVPASFPRLWHFVTFTIP